MMNEGGVTEEQNENTAWMNDGKSHFQERSYHLLRFVGIDIVV
jgi:hypothetical protein